MIDALAQGMILVVNIVNAHLFTCKDARFRKWSYVLGLATQPAWLYTTFTHGQWGIMALTAWFTATYIRGIWSHFHSPETRPAKDCNLAKTPKRLGYLGVSWPRDLLIGRGKPIIDPPLRMGWRAFARRPLLPWTDGRN